MRSLVRGRARLILLADSGIDAANGPFATGADAANISSHAARRIERLSSLPAARLFR